MDRILHLPDVRLTWFVFAVASWAVIPTASAHIQLDEPTRRQTEISGRNLQQKPAPCGRNTRSTNVSVFAPGETITVRWTETINHPGHFRIAFDNDGQDVFQDPICLSGCLPDRFENPVFDLNNTTDILLDGIVDPGGVSTFEAQVTLPNIECENCTLQLIQVMYDKAPFTRGGGSDDMYYQCADIALRQTGPVPDAGANGGDGGVDSGSPDGAADAATPDGASPTDTGTPLVVDAGIETSGRLTALDIEGGCTTFGAGEAGATFLLIGLGLMGLRRRTHKRPPPPSD